MNPTEDARLSPQAARPQGAAKWLAIRTHGVCLLFLAIAIALSFESSLHNEFVNWDDDKILLNNPNFQGLNADNLRWMFTTFHMGHYQPLTWVSFAIDYLCWGTNSAGYHGTSLLIHVANAALLYFLANRVLRSAGYLNGSGLAIGSTFAALFFAVHPLRVESVAWATERRDVLSGFFFLLVLIAYLQYAGPIARERSRWPWLALAVVFHTATLFSKATAVGLPIILLILDWYPLKRYLSRSVTRLVWEKIPFVICSAAASVLALIAETRSETVASLTAHGITARLGSAAYGLCFYLVKTVWPVALSPLVPMPERVEAVTAWFVVSALVITSLVVLLAVFCRRWPAGCAVFGSYVILLIPVLGLVQIGPQLVADRYSYLPAIGLSLLAGGFSQVMWRRAAERGRVWVFTYGAGLLGVLLLLSLLTRAQVRVWHDSVTLWRHVIRHYPDSGIAQANLGSALGMRGRLSESLHHFDRAIAVQPQLVEAHYGRGLALLGHGRIAAARSSFERVVALRPDHVDGWNNLGGALLQQGEADAAVEALERAVALHPDHVAALMNLGAALVAAGRSGEATARWTRALEAAPDSIAVLQTVAWHLATGPDEVRDGDAAVRLAERANALMVGEDANMLDILAAAYAAAGRFSESIAAAERAVRAASRAEDESWARAIESRLENYYRQHEAYRSHRP